MLKSSNLNNMLFILSIFIIILLQKYYNSPAISFCIFKSFTELKTLGRYNLKTTSFILWFFLSRCFYSPKIHCIFEYQYHNDRIDDTAKNIDYSTVLSFLLFYFIIISFLITIIITSYNICPALIEKSAITTYTIRTICLFLTFINRHGTFSKNYCQIFRFKIRF